MDFSIERVRSAIEGAGFRFDHKCLRPSRFEAPPLEIRVGATVGQSSFDVKYLLQHNLLLFNQYDIVSAVPEYRLLGDDIDALRTKKEYLESCMDEFFPRWHSLSRDKSPK